MSTRLIGLGCMFAAVLGVMCGAAMLRNDGQPAPAPAVPAPAAPARDAPTPAPKGVELLKVEAEKLAPIVDSALARQMLRGVSMLPQIDTRVVYRSKDRSRAMLEVDYKSLMAIGSDPKLTEGLERKEYDEQFYYFTGYGSPLVYARVLDVLSVHGVDSLHRKRVLDFGYGSIGHLRLMACRGCEVVGVDVEPVFRALYSEPMDTGVIFNSSRDESAGLLEVYSGHWPADAAIAKLVGVGFNIITSKNTLKRGYIHPEREVDERYLVKLGVSDEAYVRAVYEALKPGGLFVIYNIAPAQNPPDKPYLPHADGRCPFPREMLEKAGFDVLAYDKDDAAKVHQIWTTLGYDEGKGEAWLKESLFAMYTVMRKPAKAADAKP